MGLTGSFSFFQTLTAILAIPLLSTRMNTAAPAARTLLHASIRARARGRDKVHIALSLARAAARRREGETRGSSREPGRHTGDGAAMSLVYVSGYSEPMGHIKGDQLIHGIHALRLGADGRLRPANNSVATAGAPHWHDLPCHSFSHTNLKSPRVQGCPTRRC